jgi:hypothetical protein
MSDLSDDINLIVYLPNTLVLRAQNGIPGRVLKVVEIPVGVLRAV